MNFSSFSFGCRVNEAEKEALDKEMIKKGFVYNQKAPEIYIINTCTVTHKAEREARNLIYKIKKKFPKIKIIITGCAATYWQKNNFIKNLPVDLLITNKEKGEIVEIIKNILPEVPPSDLRGQKWLGLTTQKPSIFSKFLSSGRMLLKIQDGCYRFCTYCVVPYLRGQPRSEKIKNLVSRIKKEEENIAEVIFTAINTEAFGIDTKETLIDLIDQVIKKTTIPRISFGSIHPWTINSQFLNFYQKILTLNRLVNFFHIPIQSGSNTILNLMKRDYTAEEIMEKLMALKKINPLSFIATDIIVGFLGEDAKEFEKTYQFLDRSPISRFHIFRFSKRKKTAAYYMSEKINEPNEKIKKIRSQLLHQLSQKKLNSFLEKNVGRISRTLVINKKINGFYQGLTDNQLPIIIKTNKKIKEGKLINVNIKNLKNNYLIGIIS